MDLQYPIGRVDLPETVDMTHIRRWIEDMELAPQHLREAVRGLSESQLDTPYRPGGWTVRQVVHHLPDSHAQAYLNFRLGLAQDRPVANSAPINEWASMPDSIAGEIEPSLALFDGLQARWVLLLKTLSRSDFDRAIHSPDRGDRSLATLLAIYAWHGKHHVTHITALRHRMGW